MVHAMILLPLTSKKKNSLVVEPTHLKNKFVKVDHFPRDWGEHKK